MISGYSPYNSNDKNIKSGETIKKHNLFQNYSHKADKQIDENKILKVFNDLRLSNKNGISDMDKGFQLGELNAQLENRVTQLNAKTKGILNFIKLLFNPSKRKEIALEKKMINEFINSIKNVMKEIKDRKISSIEENKQLKTEEEQEKIETTIKSKIIKLESSIKHYQNEIKSLNKKEVNYLNKFNKQLKVEKLNLKNKPKFIATYQKSQFKIKEKELTSKINNLESTIKHLKNEINSLKQNEMNYLDKFDKLQKDHEDEKLNLQNQQKTLNDFQEPGGNASIKEAGLLPKEKNSSGKEEIFSEKEKGSSKKDEVVDFNKDLPNKDLPIAEDIIHSMEDDSPPPPNDDIPPPPFGNSIKVMKKEFFMLSGEPNPPSFKLNEYKKIGDEKITEDQLKEQIKEIENYINGLDQIIDPLRQY